MAEAIAKDQVPLLAGVAVEAVGLGLLVWPFLDGRGFVMPWSALGVALIVVGTGLTMRAIVAGRLNAMQETP